MGASLVDQFVGTEPMHSFEYQFQPLRLRLVQRGWHIEPIEFVEDSTDWCPFSWALESKWSPVGCQLTVNFFGDPMAFEVKSEKEIEIVTVRRGHGYCHAFARSHDSKAFFIRGNFEKSIDEIVQYADGLRLKEETDRGD